MKQLFSIISNSVTNIATPVDKNGKFDKPTNQLILGIDFDGTIVEDKFPYVGKPMPGAIEALKFLQSYGVQIILWTCRDKNFLNDALNFLAKNEITPKSANENSTLIKFITSRKIYADIYLDDRSYPGFPGWEVFIRDFKLAYNII